MSQMILTQTLLSLSGVCLFLFAVIGVFDGIYFHLIKYKLHLHPQARLEHQVHTLRAFLFGPMVYLLFAQNTGGILLWIGVFFVLLDFIAEAVDVLVEKEARASIGGVSGVEAMVHLAATSMRVLALALVLLAKPGEAWMLNAPLFLESSYPFLLSSFAKAFAVGSVLGGMQQWFMMGSGRKVFHEVRVVVSA